MTQHEIRSALYEFVLQQFPAARDARWKPDDSLLTGGIVDSLGILEIVTFIEERFGVALADDDLVADHFDSIPALAEMVAGRLSGEEVCKS